MTKIMRAITQYELGGPEVLKVVSVPRPAAGPVEVLVRVHAAGLNAADWKTRRRGGFLGDPPFTLGYDVSGTVEEVGPGVTLFQPGDEVFGMPRFPHEVGAYAEFVTAPTRHFARKPSSISHVQAAALPLASLTAWQALTATAQVQPRERVLIHAAAGGVGHVAVQLAKSLGAYVIGTARASKHDLLRELGADEVIDYTQTLFEDVAHDVDVVIDPIGGDYARRSLRTLRAGGRLVELTPITDEELIADARAEGLWAGFMLVEPDHADLKHLADLVESGHLWPRVESVFPIEKAQMAHEAGETGRTTGKLVLQIAD